MKATGRGRFSSLRLVTVDSIRTDYSRTEYDMECDQFDSIEAHHTIKAKAEMLKKQGAELGIRFEWRVIYRRVPNVLNFPRGTLAVPARWTQLQPPRIEHQPLRISGI